MAEPIPMIIVTGITTIITHEVPSNAPKIPALSAFVDSLAVKKFQSIQAALVQPHEITRWQVQQVQLMSIGKKLLSKYYYYEHAHSFSFSLSRIKLFHN